MDQDANYAETSQSYPVSNNDSNGCSHIGAHSDGHDVEDNKDTQHRIGANSNDTENNNNNNNKRQQETVSGSSKLALTEQEILAKEKSAPLLGVASEVLPGAHHVSSQEGVTRSLQLKQTEKEILAKQRASGGSESNEYSSGGETVNNSRLSQTESEILAKQRGLAPSSFSSSNKPGAHSISGDTSTTITSESTLFSGPLTQTEQDILAKQRGQAMPTNRIHQTEKDILAKQAASNNYTNAAGESSEERRPGAVAVHKTENDILTKVQFDTASNRPGAEYVYVSGSSRLSNTEQDILAKQRGTERLGNMEQDILAKQRAASNSRLEQDMELKRMGIADRGGPTATTTPRQLSQIELDLLAKQDVKSTGTGETRLSQFEIDLLTKQKEQREAGNGSSRVGQLEQKILEKQCETYQGVTISGAVGSGRDKIGSFERALLTKQGKNSFEEENDTKKPASSSSLSQFEADMESKNVAQSLLRASQARSSNNALMNNLEASILAKSSSANNITSFNAGEASRARLPRNLATLEADLCGKNPQPHPMQPQFITLSPRTAPIDDGRPDTGEDSDTGPPPLQMPEYSGQLAASASQDSSGGGIEAYVPRTVVDAAGVAVVDTEAERRREKQSRMKFVVFGMICLIAIAIAIVVPSIVTSLDDSDEAIVAVATGPSSVPSVAPSVAPSAAPTSSLFSEFVEEVLRPIEAISDVAIDSRTSPQYNAALWLILEDSETYWPRAGLTVKDPQVLQRWLLAVFHYALDGNFWRRCGNKSNECGGNVIRWLTASHECTWFGVSCGSKGDVESLIFQQERGNNMQGTLPPEISLLTVLKRLILPDNAIRANITTAFQGFTQLDTIVLTHNDLTGSLPVELITNNQQLGVLNLGNNQLTGTLPIELTSARQLSHLQLFQNGFTGPIPDDIGSATRLQLLDLSSNGLEGSIPQSLYNLSGLTALSLGGNGKLSGTIDTLIGQLTSLRRLNLGGTRLQGTIPDPIYLNLANLQQMRMSNANFSGPLKEELRLLNATLAILELNNNSLTGSLPSALDYLTAMETMLLHDNLLVGTISSTVCSERGLGPGRLQQFYVDCNIECNCNDNPVCSRNDL